MALDTNPPDQRSEQAGRPPVEPIDYHAAEGIEPPKEDTRREWSLVGAGLAGLVAVVAIVVAVVALASSGSDSGATATAAATPAAASHDGQDAAATAPTLEDAKGVAFEKFQPVDPTLPDPVTKVEVDVYQHVTQVSKDLAPTEVWSFKVNGVEHRGTGASAPIVVEEGTTVDFTFTNGGTKAMKVDMPHALDFHSAEVDPGRRYADVQPGKSISYKFEAKHPGVFMYHCATQPVLMHTGAGMVGMMVVKPKNLAPVDRELWITQQEFYIGEPGKDADMAKMNAKQPDVIAFNGFANQYADNPITVKKGEKIRMYVLNAGPSIGSAFHVIGTVFDKAHTDNGVQSHVQTINLAPSQGGWVEFTLDEEGTYPFVNHAFGDMVKGSMGVLKTENAPEGSGHGGHAGSDHGAASDDAAAAKADVNVEMGEMFIKADVDRIEAGKRTFAVKNTGSTTHGMAFAITPVKQSGGMLDESALQSKGKELSPGESEVITADLKPGKYELVCFIPGHYAAGQKLAFEVR
jgi:uncharacterized cupredoxin-like copper-binding protein